MKMFAKVSQFVGNTFAIWVLLFAILGFLLPESFTWVAPHIPLLLGVIMFGMGMTLKVSDFTAVFKHPKHVAIGVLAQFTVMPLLAFILAISFSLPPEVAAGVILVGCCPGGTASNVITYLARGNTALSVAITTVSTLLAPFVTPFLIWALASKWLPISASSLFMSIVKIVLVPIILGLVVKILFSKQVENAISVLPLVSVLSIVLIVAAVIGLSKEKIIESGLLLFLIVILHNGLGLLCGYWLARLLKMNIPAQKAVSIEVGMQNSGLGAALAGAHFSPLAAVPSALFSVWHNISGPILATWWGRKQREEIRTDVSVKS
ncbi:bile acid:sodium symporter family protein [Aeribacillus kexueae]|uniref:bile acid:sodium symporter family protein n=1 Tax=Aeribacillus kexueae TaxID=2078952 RepID=UPI003AF19804